MVAWSVRPFPLSRVSVLTGASLLASLSFSAPAMAITEYLGGGAIVVSDSCAQYGWTGTQQVVVRLEPQGERGNAADDTQMSVLFNTGTMAFRMNLNRGVRFDYTPTQAIYIWNGPHIPQEPITRFAFNPNADWVLGAGGEIERLSVIISNFNEHMGCVAWLRASLARN